MIRTNRQRTLTTACWRGFVAIPLLLVVIGSPAQSISAANAITSAVAGCPAPDPMAAMPAVSPAAQTDLQLLDALIADHVRAITLANDGLSHAQASDVRRFALRSTESQAGELQLLRAWRNAWYPGAPTPESDFAAPSPSSCFPGEPYDRAFVQMLIATLQQSVDHATIVAERADHRELRNLAESIVQARSLELLQTRAWLSGN